MALTAYDIKRILRTKKSNTTPVDDFRIIDSWTEYNDSRTGDVNSRPLNYLCYQLETIDPESGETKKYYKAIKFARVIRLPKSAKQSTSMMDMQAQILSGVYEQGYNLITLIANVMKPVALGLLYLYGVQGVSEDIEDAKERANDAFLGFTRMMQGTFRVLEMRDANAEETEWLREKMYNMEYITAIRGIPKASKAGEDAGNKGLGGDNINPDSQGTLEELIAGMSDYEYVLEIISTPVFHKTLVDWQRTTQRDMTTWNSQLQGTKAFNLSMSVPMMFSSNQSTSQGWNKGYSDARSVSYTQGESFGTSHGVSENHGISQSFSESFGRTTGVNVSESVTGSHGVSKTQSQSASYGTSIGKNMSIGSSEGTSTNESTGTSQGQSFGISQNYSRGKSFGESIGRSEGTSMGTSYNFGQGRNSSVSESTGLSEGKSVNQSHSDSQNVGGSASSNWNSGSSSSMSASAGRNSSASEGTSRSDGTSWNEGQSSGMNLGAGAFGVNVGGNRSTSSSEGGSHSDGQSNSVSSGNSIGASVSSGRSDSVGGSSGSSWGQGVSNSAGIGESYSVTSGASSSSGISANESWGVNQGTNQSQSISQNRTESQSIGSGVSSSQNIGTSSSVGWGKSVGTSNSVGRSVGTSSSKSASASAGESWGISQGRSVGQSESQSTTKGVSSGTTDSYGKSTGVNQGISNAKSQGQTSGNSFGTSGAYVQGVSSSMGLSSGVGYSKSYQWLDQSVKDILELLEYENERIKRALRGNGAFYTYVYLACPNQDALSVAQAVAKSTWHNEYAMTQPLQVLNLTREEQKHLLYRFAGFSSDVSRETVAGFECYRYATVLLPNEYVAYTHLPRISEGGVFADINDMPKFAVPSMMSGEIFMGKIVSGERFTMQNGYMTPFDFRIDERELMHGYFTGASRSGKTVAAMRFIAELSQIRRKHTGKRMRIVCMDPKRDWRTLARFVEPERFRFYSLGNALFHPIKLNPLKIPKGVQPQVWIDGLIDIYCRAYGLLERGKQMMGETIYSLYEDAGVFEACKLPDWEQRVHDLSAEVTFEAVYKKMSDIKVRLEDPTNPKGRAGNDTRDAYARLLDRLQAFSRPFSIEHKLFGTSEGIGIDELIGDDDITILESAGLESTFQNFIFGVITSGFFKWAKAHEGGYLAESQYETVLVIEEANQVLTGNDAAGTGGGASFGMTGQSEFEQILDQAAGYGLFIMAITQKISQMPSSVIANSGLIFAGRLVTEDDINVVVRALGRDARIDDRDVVKWFPRSPTGRFICKSSRTFDFKDSEPIMVQISPLNIAPPSNAEIEEILSYHGVRRSLANAVRATA